MYSPKTYSQRHPLPPSETLPTMYDLPSEDAEEPGLPDEFHHFQPLLLRETCQPETYSPNKVFVGTDLNLYYDGRNPGWHKRPDWFLVLGVDRARAQADLRWSYVTWQESVHPFLVVELLSPGTEDEDFGKTLREVNRPPTKWQVYEQKLRIPYYVVFDRYESQFRLFQLIGSRYEEQVLSEQYHWVEELSLGLGVWQGEYKGIQGKWLRWKAPDGSWIPTSDERAEQANMRAEQLVDRVEQADMRAEQLVERVEQADMRAEQADQRAEKLAAQLKALGINPEDT